MLWLTIAIWFGGLKYGAMTIASKLWLLWLWGLKYGLIWSDVQNMVGLWFDLFGFLLTLQCYGQMTILWF